MLVLLYSFRDALVYRVELARPSTCLTLPGYCGNERIG